MFTTVREGSDFVKQWRIPNYKQVDSKCGKGKKWSSAKFRLDHKSWSLALYPKGHHTMSHYEEGNVSLLLVAEGTPVTVRDFSVCAVTPRGSLSLLKTAPSLRFRRFDRAMGFVNLVTRERLLQHCLQVELENLFINNEVFYCRTFFKLKKCFIYSSVYNFFFPPIHR